MTIRRNSKPYSWALKTTSTTLLSNNTATCAKFAHSLTEHNTSCNLCTMPPDQDLADTSYASPIMKEFLLSHTLILSNLLSHRVCYCNYNQISNVCHFDCGQLLSTTLITCVTNSPSNLLPLLLALKYVRCCPTDCIVNCESCQLPSPMWYPMPQSNNMYSPVKLDSSTNLQAGIFNAQKRKYVLPQQDQMPVLHTNKFPQYAFPVASRTLCD